MNAGDYQGMQNYQGLQTQYLQYIYTIHATALFKRIIWLNKQKFLIHKKNKLSFFIFFCFIGHFHK